MSATLTLLNIIGAVALLLWGTRMVRLGFTRAYATSLQQLIAKSTNNRIKAFLAGLGVTTVLQSSTATTMICASFASKHMITLAAAIAVVIGADIGTTIVAQILIFDLSWLMPLLILIGVIMHHKYEHGGRKRHIARAFIGLGLILLALSMIKTSGSSLSGSDTLPLILSPLEDEPVLAILVAALLTWLLHSSLASVLIIATFVSQDVISVDLALKLVLGANLGAAIVAYVMSFSMGTQAQRITTANLMMRLICVIIALPFIHTIAPYFTHPEILQSRDIINFHMAFNIALAVIFLPFVSTLSRLVEKIVPEKKAQEESKNSPLYLDESALNSPTIALASAARETLRIAKIVEDMFSNSMIALKEESTDALNKVRTADDQIDDLYQEVKLYLTRVSEEALDPKESDRFVQILSFSTNLEHIGDIIDSSLIDITNSKINNKVRFSKDGFQEIRQFHNKILTNMKIAQAIFMSEDPTLARQLVEGKAEVRKAAQQSTQAHFERLREGIPETKATSSMHTDIIRDYKRINSYITSVAFTILENAELHKAQRKEKDAI